MLYFDHRPYQVRKELSTVAKPKRQHCTSTVDIISSQKGQITEVTTIPLIRYHISIYLAEPIASLLRPVVNHPNVILEQKNQEQDQTTLCIFVTSQGATRWTSNLKASVSCGILFLKHLNLHGKAGVAHFLTSCQMDFFFTRAHVLVLRLDGLCDNVLLRFAQHTEVPIPACPAQGAFQVTFYPRGATNGTLSWMSCAIGRIGSFDHAPAQVQLDVCEQNDVTLMEGDECVQFLEQQVEASRFQKVLCTPEGQDSVMCLRFLIPIRLDRKLPLSLSLKGRRIVINHPSPATVLYLSAEGHLKNKISLSIGKIRPTAPSITEREGTIRCRIAPNLLSLCAGFIFSGVGRFFRR